jgi:hypothetical protein
MEKVTVYAFEVYDIVADRIFVPGRMATIGFIERIGRVPIMDTAKEVDATEVDEEGRYPIRAK